MQRALQRADAADDRRVDVGERGRSDSRRKRGRVQLVVGVQDQRAVEGADRERVGPLPGELVEEVRGKTHHRIGVDRPQVLLHAPDGRDQGPDLRRETDGLPVVRRRRIVGGIAVVVRQGRRQRAQRVHRLARRQLTQQPDHAVGQRTRRGELRLQLAQLRAVRQAAMPQQVADFFEGRLRRQVVDVVSAVGENAALAVDEADARAGGDDVFEAGLGFDLGGHGPIIQNLFTGSQVQGFTGSSFAAFVRSGGCRRSYP